MALKSKIASLSNFRLFIPSSVQNSMVLYNAKNFALSVGKKNSWKHLRTASLLSLKIIIMSIFLVLTHTATFQFTFTIVVVGAYHLTLSLVPFGCIVLSNSDRLLFFIF